MHRKPTAQPLCHAHLSPLPPRLLTGEKIFNLLPSRGSLCPPGLASGLGSAGGPWRPPSGRRGSGKARGLRRVVPLHWDGSCFHHSSHSPGRPDRDMSVTVQCYVMSDGNRRRCEQKLTGKLWQCAYLDATLAE